MKTINEYRNLFAGKKCIAVDVDDTIVLWKGANEFDINYPLVNALIEWKRLNPENTLLIWSGQGTKYARHIMGTLTSSLAHVADYIGSKPFLWIDDNLEWLNDSCPIVEP